MIDKATIQDFVDLILSNHSYTCWVEFARDDNYIWAYVFGYLEPEGMICVKEAYCPLNSLMHDYDIDWVMPYDSKSGDVFDTECCYIISDTLVTDIHRDLGWHTHNAQNLINKYVGKYKEGE